MFGCNLSAQNGDDVSVFALHAHPLSVVVDSDRGVVDVHAHFGGFEKKFFHDLAAQAVGGLKQDAKRQAMVNVALTDVENRAIESAKYAGQCRRYARFVVPGYAD